MISLRVLVCEGKKPRIKASQALGYAADEEVLEMPGDAAQRRYWVFYEAITFLLKSRGLIQ